jgi:hypothetical protein
MIITAKPTLKNYVYSTSLAVELNPKETAYAEAYGEPKIDRAGTITFERTVAPATPADLNTNSVMGAGVGTFVLAGGLGVGGLAGSAAGTFTGAEANGVLRRDVEVVGDFTLATRLADVYEFSAGRFLVGLASLDGIAPDTPGVFFGWGSDGVTPGVHLWQRGVTGGSLTAIGSFAAPSPRGVSLRLSRLGSVLTAAYSLDAGVTWATMGTATLALQAQTVGVFANSAHAATPAEAVLTDTYITNSGVAPTNTFVIQGGPDLGAVRSSSPHTFYLDGKIDPEAEAKVEGWQTTVVGRLQAAMAELMAKPAPGTVNGMI